MNLKSNGTYRYNGGDNLCGGEDDTKVKNGVFELNEEHTIITFDKGTDDEFSANIESVSSTELKLSGIWAGLTIEGTYKPE